MLYPLEKPERDVRFGEDPRTIIQEIEKLKKYLRDFYSRNDMVENRLEALRRSTGQSFDYAPHWLQKTKEHVMDAVSCLDSAARDMKKY